MHRPSLSARSKGNEIFVEVCRDVSGAEDLLLTWVKASQINNGTVYVMSPNLPILQSVLNQINIAKDRHPGHIKRLYGANLRDYSRGKRNETDGSLWTYVRR